MSHYHITIEGISPLMLDAFPVCTELPTAKSTMRGKKPSPTDAADACLYKDADGELFVPGPNIFSAIIAAGQFVKQGKRQLSTGKSSIIPGGITLIEPELVLDPQAWVPDSRPIVNAMGSRTIKHRPRFDKWRLEFTLEVDSDEFSPEEVRLLVDIAGRKIGIGSFRPQRKGPFGRFVVIHWKELT